jgi:predicted RNA-binding Zn-ribbon protein involved in translation (DUF1610 family)
MPKMTTSVTNCPKCGHSFKLETKGILGGIIAQMFMHSILDKAKKRKQGMDFECGRCGHKWTEKE